MPFSSSLFTQQHITVCVHPASLTNTPKAADPYIPLFKNTGFESRRRCLVGKSLCRR
ncbi:hypothetical protein CC77DRAFT_699442 [Alternaria alternata]|uniref:Uncharacterized protein n=1 Tax=Alternaria alternata TaxID=5599 RepID=A0A177DVH7_ALTAL|nr:hypothetical protein CC77DRAFT_699442 [Alternaria alternata]OAG23181.1 hypothetical protein CC77DRAFT_699442 [Alternaria alternata]